MSLISLIARAVSDPVGVRVPCHNPEQLRQAIEREFRGLPERPALSVLARRTSAGPEVWLLKTEFMDGKKLNEQRLRAKLDQLGRHGSPPD